MLRTHDELVHLKESNQRLLKKAIDRQRNVRLKRDIVASMDEISLLLSFKIADLINIALEAGSYFKSKEWYAKHSKRLLIV